ncbi:MAG: 50S ribosomal protein L15 [Candidatus Methanoperedenaceae archaeon GB50]|nr:MAG: 50S ribosomal protein L15 [Candidatus Methanoperedenaceae archaeon GB50]CAD7771258.1 50S ribosomal protein L15 [Candidatus Methanoperedenaceae archaeon GB50]CAD7772406.1 50S ribosomal protein L15 [Candidatus Methanoperedenaceae archaeon GB37]
MISLNNLKPPYGAIRKKKRVGRGDGSGHGNTCGRGQKGQKARSGGQVKPYFEGGQMPLYRRLPKRGFKNIFKEEFAIINIRDLVKKFRENEEVTPEKLLEVGLIKKKNKRIKLLGDGDISFPLLIKVHKISQQAKSKIEAAGGKIEVI